MRIPSAKETRERVAKPTKINEGLLGVYRDLASKAVARMTSNMGYVTILWEGVNGYRWHDPGLSKESLMMTRGALTKELEELGYSVGQTERGLQVSLWQMR